MYTGHHSNIKCAEVTEHRSADLNVYICGDSIMTAAEYALLQSTRGSCQGSCTLSSTTLAVPSQYYWTVSDWSTCTASCGGGTQSRTAACMNSITGGSALSPGLLQGHTTPYRPFLQPKSQPDAGNLNTHHCIIMTHRCGAVAQWIVLDMDNYLHCKATYLHLISALSCSIKAL